jgi:hypothetical protein
MKCRSFVLDGMGEGTGSRLADWVLVTPRKSFGPPT